MESFLKYLHGGAAAGNQRAPVVATTIAASACEDGGGDVEDDASFFDLELAVPGDERAASDDAEEERVEFNFAVAGDEVVAVAESEKDDGAGEKEAAQQAPPPASKFRVLLLKLRKPKPDGAAAKSASRFLIKLRVDDAPPLASLFSRDNSSRSSDAAAQPQPQDGITAEERRFAKEVVLKYLNKIKPLYVKVSRRRFPGGEGEETDSSLPSSPAPCSSPSVAAAPVACGVRAPRAGLKQVCKRLGKSRSASSAVAAAPAATPQRRDDSLLQLQDGIQSAIAHCKRSFNASSQGTYGTVQTDTRRPLITVTVVANQWHLFVWLVATTPQGPSRRRCPATLLPTTARDAPAPYLCGWDCFRDERNG
jgi:hypothetical protein